MIRSCAGIVIVAVLLTFAGCGSPAVELPLLDKSSHAFVIHWPPLDPESAYAESKTPLLLGKVDVTEANNAGGSDLQIRVTIDRPTSEEDRQRWNEQLSFSDVPWMDDVRVWDQDNLWQWPNLPYLLKKSGEERVERYGGVDPGKLVDNDFAAFVIRKIPPSGPASQNDSDAPIISANWRGDVQPANVHSLVHQAKSDWLSIPLDGQSGKFGVWLIYADFLGAYPPAAWPREPEWAGGILAYCEIDWQKRAGKGSRGSVRFMKPPRNTGVDWEAWSESPITPDA